MVITIASFALFKRRKKNYIDTSISNKNTKPEWELMIKPTLRVAILLIHLYASETLIGEEKGLKARNTNIHDYLMTLDPIN